MTAQPADDLRQLLPADMAARVQSLRLADGVVTLVLDGAGLDGDGRAALEAGAKATLSAAPGVSEVRVGIVADRDAPPPAPKGPLILAVGSGKGGVGKSTLSANLAVALSRMGVRVGLVDADIYGPSQPRLLANEGKKPEAKDSKMFPVPSPYGVSVLSMGHLIEDGRAIAWRGPMVSGALGQLIDAWWGETQVLVIDLPPGTGDVQLTMVQKHKPAGAVIVSTPQDLALMDASRALNLFEAAHVPVLGLVENMAGYVCPHCGNVSDPFGCGAVEDAAKRLDMPFLGRVPLDMAIRLGSDAGQPPAAGEGPQAEAFAAIARKLLPWLATQGVTPEKG
ncbi:MULTISPECIES: Mrp/NBP35 family ATP-binding protein [unclassified Novosphingobium]|uniref:Mrp/NBP35 family ATP-binding protein n=1 Tax=unclassified Novosphingobium TaxID=2644732 RepID=UPI00086BDB43|nr:MULTISPECIES: Mrp/NBP35 family ATP-binding protein [unclassified Novosphingobium]MBN9142307.1 Mrp/NBP35 family ATP-binding protein [Novosphingobium sp.]MDR6708860.1 ATP-binding protein involved in chromosome partitioning [Novosphingobium sp. 1748]ODU78441.1 MAG: chromosome partitioning protein ParA [Novosphingobium sp. SCN 63-17]OJX90500.1 MAG: chromosome partitioning protein ParA [Novosphingobium sp. 63-713]